MIPGGGMDPRPRHGLRARREPREGMGLPGMRAGLGGEFCRAGMGAEERVRTK